MAMRAAAAGAGRLPAALLFSDRDFNADDYEALLALDDGLESRRGASPDTIAALPTARAPAAAVAAGDRCAICLEEYEQNTTLRTLPCGHGYHVPCADRWLAAKATCPVCQGKV
jgi:hypothetical protein